MKKIILSLFLLFINTSVVCAYQIPKNLDKAIIAEDTSGDLTTYLNIVSCVRNRLINGQNHGFVAMKRRNLNTFVKKECEYALRIKGVNLENQVKKAIYEVFVLNKDYCDGATNYEHTGKYKIPKYTKKMRVVKKLYEGSRNEITFWRER